MSDPGYSILSARYANHDHTAVIAHTLEAGEVAASARDRPALWARIHRVCSVVAPYNPRAAVQPPPVVVEPEASAAAQEAPQQPPPLSPLPPPPEPVMAVPEPLAQSQPMPLPPPPEQAFTISDLLARADAPEPKIVPTLLEIGSLPSLSNPDSEPMKRERAKSRVMGAVRRVGQSVIGDQVRYELALKAMNDNVVAIQLLEEEANIRKLSVRELAVQIVEDRRVRERRMMQVYAILARASANIDNATGRTIDTLADKAVQEIAALED